MQVYNAIQLKNGKKSKDLTRVSTFSQPIQFLPQAEKDLDWYMSNADWLEWQGIKQVKLKSKRLLKNYQLANGVIDKRDYMPVVENDMHDIISQLTAGSSDDPAMMELEFYPIVPSLITVLTGEFSKRATKIDYRAVDEYSANEILTKKTQEIESVLIEYAEQQLLQQMIQMGLDPNSEEAQQQLNPEALKQLPEISDFYNKTYQTQAEIWASKQHHIDVNRFHMDELEEMAFYDSLVSDSAYFHFRMLDDDYVIEGLNPVMVFTHESAHNRYASNANYGGFFDLITVADALDMYGYLMAEDQQRSLETIHATGNAKYLDGGIGNNGDLYNANETYAENREHGVDFKRFLSFKDNQYSQEDIIDCIVGQANPLNKYLNTEFLRVCTMYWKTQRKVGFLTEIDENGELIVDTVDEHFIVLNKPLYNKTFQNKETPENLIFGQHIEWFYINQTVGVVKLGSSLNNINSATNQSNFTPIYLGIDRSEPGPLKFQFKGETTLYGAKIPIEGTRFSRRNSRSNSFVDLLTPSQIGFNMVNNQIKDIIIDELGPVVVLDQNALPKHSMGEDWGPNNFQKAYVAMKDFSILPLDPSIANTENPTNFQHYQVLNMEQTGRLMSRIQLANYFKQQAMEIVGVTPQRMGQQLGQINNATGSEQAVTGSYNQTEKYFVQFCDWLMPRVHQMRTDLAQFYHSQKKSSFRLQSSLSGDERVNFEINGTDLLLADINVYCATNANNRAVLEKMKAIFANNNTSGASLYDLGKLEQSDTIGAMNKTMKELEKKAEKNAMAQREAESKNIQMEIEAKKAEKQMELDHEAREKEKDRRARLMEAEIKAAGYGAMQDMNQNKESDFKDALDAVHQSEQYQQTMGLNKEKENNKMNIAQQKLDIEREKNRATMLQNQTALQIARENKNKFDKK